MAAARCPRNDPLPERTSGLIRRSAAISFNDSPHTLSYCIRAGNPSRGADHS